MSMSKQDVKMSLMESLIRARLLSQENGNASGLYATLYENIERAINCLEALEAAASEAVTEEIEHE